MTNPALKQRLKIVKTSSTWRENTKDFSPEVVETSKNLASEKIGFMVRASTRCV